MAGNSKLSLLFAVLFLAAFLLVAGPSAFAQTTQGPPTNLTATAVSSSQIDLKWSPPSGTSVITGYMIERSTNGGSTWSTLVSNTNSTSTNYSDAGLAPSTTYAYRVSAISQNLTSSPSNTATATTQNALAAPGSPVALSAKAGNSQALLSWTAPAFNGGSAITGYKIYRSTISGSESLVAKIGNTTSFTNTGLTNGITYYYEVTALNSIGESSPSNEVAATPMTIPGAPSGLAAASVSYSQINLLWKAPSNNGGSAISGYKIERESKNISWSTIVPNTGSNATTYSDTGLEASTAYTYRVSAINSFGTSNTSNTASATTKAPTVSGSPANPTATAVSSSQINLSWAAPSNDGGSAITGYKVDRSADNGTVWSIIQPDTNSTATTYSDMGLNSSTAYTYRVSAINSVGTSLPSSTAAATTLASAPAPTAPGAPTGLAATAVSSSQINLSWAAPSNDGGSAITGYKVDRSADNGTVWSIIQPDTNSTATTYSDMGLNSSTAYTYRVSAINSVGTGPGSNTATDTTAGFAPATSSASSIALNGIWTTSATVSSAPYQVTLANVNAGTGSSNLLVVGVTADNEDVASILFNGAQLTKQVSSFTNNDAEFWYLKNPAGSGNIIVTMRGPTSAIVGAYLLSGVDQTTPIPTSVKSVDTCSPTCTNPSISIITANPNSMVLDMPAIYGGRTLSSPTCTQGWDMNVPSAITGASSSIIQASAGTVTCSWTASGASDLWDDVAIEVKAAGMAPATAPGSPTGLAAEAGNSQVLLSWSPPSSNGGNAITNYKIYRSTAPGNETLLTTVGNVNSYNDTGLANGITYYYKVAAVNSVGESAPSNEAYAMPTAAATAPGTPSGLTATSISSSQIDLSWVDPSSNGGSAITGYKIERSNNTGATWMTVQPDTNSTTTKYSDTGLAENSTYAYRVSAINSVGTGSPSDTATATTPTASTVPGSPTGLAATVLSQSQINLKWQTPSSNGGSPITGYMIERSSNLGKSWSAIQQNTKSTSTDYSDIGLASDTTYTYRVSAINGVGPSLPSNTVSATTGSSSLQYSIGLAQSGVMESDTLANETQTQPQLASSSKYWIYGGDALAEHAPYDYSRDLQGLHIGVEAPSNGTWAGIYALARNTNATLYHAVLNSPAQTLPVNGVYFEPGMFVQTNGSRNVNFVTCASSTSSFGITWGVFSATGNVNGATNFTRLWYDPSPNQPLTRDCTLITNGNNYLKAYIDGKLVFNSTHLNLQMPTPFMVFMEPQSSYSGQLLNETFKDYYATSSENVTVTNLPNDARTVDIVDGSGSILSTSTVMGSSAALDIGQYHFPLPGTIKVYGSNNTLIASGSVNMYGGDVYSLVPHIVSNTASPSVLNSVQTTSGTVSGSSRQLTLANVTAGTGSANLLLVGISSDNASVYSVAYKGTNLTKAVSSFHNNDAELWFLKNSTGTGNLVVTMKNSTSAVVGAYSFSGVDQTSPIAATAENHNVNDSSPAITIATKSPDDWVLDLPSIYGGTTLGSPTCAQEWNLNVTEAIRGASSSTISSSAGSVTCGWSANNGGDMWDDVAVELKASSIASTVPDSPTRLAASAMSSSQINLSWSEPSNNGGSAITGYEIERSEDGGTTWSAIVSNTGSAGITYYDTGLGPTTTYTYRVSAINSVGTSLPSDVSSATTTPPPKFAAMTLTTNAVHVGEDIRVTGKNFAPGSQVTLSFDGTAIGIDLQDVGSGSTTPSTVVTDTNGNFVGIVQVLVSTAGTHTIHAQDASMNTANQPVTVMPHAYIFPTTGKPGSSVLIPTSQGNGYAANSAITIKFDATTITPGGGIMTDSSGNFGGTFTIPANATAGTHTISISDNNGNTYSTPFTVDPNAHAFSSKIVASGMNFAGYFAFIPDKGQGVDGSGAFMANEKNTGNVDVFKQINGTFVKQPVPFVTVQKIQAAYETNGLLGIALDPNWANSNSSKYVYMYVTRNQTVNGAATNNVIGQVVRYHAITDSSGNIVADQSLGEQVVLGNIPAFSNGHNGGSLKFDPQGNLLISVGDGWQFGVSQQLTSLQGKILRITPVYAPVNGQLYTIPPTNPFASSNDTGIKKEIWGYGIRQGYAYDVDSKTGKIYVSDTGFNSWESINNMTAPASNAGWPDYESPPYGNPDNLSNYVPPVYWYPHQGVEPLTGITAGLEALSAGAFYHGTTYPGLDGAYFFGDYGVGNVEALLPSNTSPPTVDQASGHLMGQVAPILYGLPYAPIYMEEWNGKLYFLDLNGNLNVLNYN